MESIKRFCSEEFAQTTTEYVLMIAMVLGMALLVIRDLVQPVIKWVGERISEQVESRLFKPGSFHRMSF
jgi:hypothetical protein